MVLTKFARSLGEAGAKDAAMTFAAAAAQDGQVQVSDAHATWLGNKKQRDLRLQNVNHPYPLLCRTTKT